MVISPKRSPITSRTSASWTRFTRAGLAAIPRSPAKQGSWLSIRSWERKLVATGTPSRFAQCFNASHASLVHEPPPARIMPRLASARAFMASLNKAWSNPGLIIWALGLGCSWAWANKTSSGRANTTGPLRPDWARWNAWEMYSSIRSARSMLPTHLAHSEYTLR